MPGGIAIREADPSEHGEVARVMLGAYRQYGPPPEDPSYPLWAGYFDSIVDVASRLHDSVLIGAFDGTRAVGAVTYYPVGRSPEEPGSSREGWPPEWCGFRLLAVDPAVRGRGVGRLLTEECLRRGREEGAKAVGLHTTEAMAVARDMYERMGFVRAPERDFHPSPDLHVMAYVLEM